MRLRFHHPRPDRAGHPVPQELAHHHGKTSSVLNRAAVAVALALVILASPALAQITASPPSVSLAPGQRSTVISLSFSPTPGPATASGTISFTGLPTGVSTIPVPPDTTAGAVPFTVAAGAPIATASFRFATTSATPPGTHSVTMTATNVTCGGVLAALPCVGTMMLTVVQPSFTTTVTPNPVRLTWGAAPQTVTVTTNPDPGFTENITYTFGGFPSGVSWGSPMSWLPTYPPLTFPFAAASGTPPGTYTGTLTGISPGLSPKTIPFTVIVEAPGILLSLAQPAITVCDGGAPVDNAVNLQPINGYAGIPTLDITGVPAGMSVSPSPLIVSSLPPARTVPFAVAANGASPGMASITIRARDASAGVDTAGLLSVNVTPSDFSAALLQPSATIAAGGSASAYRPIVNGSSCFTAKTVTVTPSGAPAGTTFTPPTMTLSAPSYGSGSFDVQVAPSVAPGAYPLLFTFSASDGTVRTASGTLTVTSTPDFTLTVSPASLQVVAGASANVTVTANPTNGFSGQVSVTAPVVPGVTFSPAAFVLAAGASQTVAVTVALTASAQTNSAVFSATAPGVIGTRTASLSLTVAPPPDFALAVNPVALEIVAGRTASLTATVTGLNGFKEQVSVTAPVVPGVTFSPAAFVLAAGASQTVAVTVALTAPAQTNSAVFSATAPGVIGTRTASLSLTVAPPPDFALAVSPAALTIEVGRTGTAVVSATGINGFSGPVTVTAATAPDVTVAPATFALLPGTAQAVSIVISPTALPGSRTVRFDGVGAEVAGTRQASVALTVVPQAPVIDFVTPPAVAAGTFDVLLRLHGTNFRPGASATSPSAAITISSTVVISPTTAEAAVSFRPDAAPGPHRIDLVNTDGTRTTTGGVVLLYPQSSLAAPLGVTAAAVVHPRPYTLLDPEQPLFPRGLLATTGMGTITGSWTLDGFPFDHFVVQTAGGMPVEITSELPIPPSSIGEHRLELVIEQPRSLVSAPIPVVQATGSHSRLAVYAPQEGDVVEPGESEFRWSLVPGASGYQVEFESAPGSQPLLIRLSNSKWTPTADDLALLGPGSHRFRIRAVYPGEVGGQATPWQTFILPDSGTDDTAEPAPAPREPAAGTPGGISLAGLDQAYDAGQNDEPNLVPAVLTGADDDPDAPSTSGLTRDGEASLTLAATATDASDGYQSDAARLELSANLDVQSGRFQAKGAGDVSGRRDLDAPNATASESRNWDLLFGVGSDDFRTEARGGYSPPDFLDQSELLSAGLARGGVEGKVIAPIGSVAYYRSTRSIPASLGMQPFAASRRVEAIGIEAPGDPARFILRAFALRTTGEPTADGGGDTSEAIGVLGRFTLGQGMTLVFEGANGRNTSDDGRSIDGAAFKLGLAGLAGRVNYSLNLRKTDADFVNPINTGFTPGGVPDRVGGDLSLSGSLGSAMVSLQARRLRSGGNDGSPTVTEDGGSLSLLMPLGSGINASATANLTTASGAADEANMLPATDRTQKGVMVTLSEMVGSTSLSQSLSWQDMSDRTFTGLDQSIVSANLNAYGAVSPMLSLSGMLSATRSDGSRQVGRTDQVLLSLQPVVTLSAVNLTVTPRASYSRSENDTSGSTSESEQYQVILDWAPPWFGSLLALQLSTDLSRSMSSFQPSRPAFSRRIVAAVTVRGGAGFTPPMPVTDTAGLGPAQRPYLGAGVL